MTSKSLKALVGLGILLALPLACSSPATPPLHDGGEDAHDDLGAPHETGPHDLRNSDADGPKTPDIARHDTLVDIPQTTGPCTKGQRRCAGTLDEARCENGSSGFAWVNYACPKDQVCVNDRCVAACVDTCYWGETRKVGGVTERCRLYTAKTSTYGGLMGTTHDRMRDYLAWIHRHHLPNGYISGTLFADTTFNKEESYLGTVDAGEWTGVYLTSEALRLMTTRSPDAERSVKAEAERICQLFDVTSTKTPQPGYMARFWAPLGENPLWDAIYNKPDDVPHRKTTYQGKSVFYIGNTSRDMYHGALLGLGLAYDALQTPKDKKRIRHVVLTLVGELIRERKKVPVKVVWGTNAIPVPITVDLQHAILVPDEMDNGAILIRIGTKTDANDWDHSELHGLREFFPDFAPVLRQVLK
ncbi:MAG: hypothetical protein KAI47_19855, partial [Deltaproteobacteria bacterium]|nr:hypothetical protein [Deltaproteobacteria bacterium]